MVRGLSSRVAKWIDDYVEEVAVGTPWWVLVPVFGISVPLAVGVAAWLLHVRYQSGTYAELVILGALVGLGLRLIARERERYRRAAIDRSGDIASLRKLGWGDFEVVVGEALRRQGYLVKERGGFKADGGVDLIAEGKHGRIAVQCKQWRQWIVGVSQVRELYGTVMGGGYTAGWLVTCGRFTTPAREWAKGKDLRLIDGEDLIPLIGQEQGEGESARLTASSASAPQPVPNCPSCGKPMRRLENKSDGSEFWACTGYPACRWTAEDAPQSKENVRCSRGHPMDLRTTPRGTEYWRCSTYPNCYRTRIAGSGLSSLYRV